MAQHPLDESIVDQQLGHLGDHDELHKVHNVLELISEGGANGDVLVARPAAPHSMAWEPAPGTPGSTSGVQVFNVLDYGAQRVPNYGPNSWAAPPAFDSTSAFMAAKDDAANADAGVVYAPHGLYTARIELPPQCGFIGDGWATAIHAPPLAQNPSNLAIVAIENNEPLENFYNRIGHFVVIGNRTIAGCDEDLVAILHDPDYVFGGNPAPPPAPVRAGDRLSTPAQGAPGLDDIFAFNASKDGFVVGAGNGGSWYDRLYSFWCGRRGLTARCIDSAFSNLNLGVSFGDANMVTESRLGYASGANRVVNAKLFGGSDNNKVGQVGGPGEPPLGVGTGGLILMGALWQFTNLETQDNDFGTQFGNPGDPQEAGGNAGAAIANVLRNWTSDGDLEPLRFTGNAGGESDIDMWIGAADNNTTVKRGVVIPRASTAKRVRIRVHLDTAPTTPTGTNDPNLDPDFVGVALTGTGTRFPNWDIDFAGFGATQTIVPVNNVVQPDPFDGMTVRVTLTDNVDIQPPNGRGCIMPGDRLVFLVRQDAIGGWNITWDASFGVPASPDLAPNAITIFEFVNLSADMTPVWGIVGPSGTPAVDAEDVEPDTIAGLVQWHEADLLNGAATVETFDTAGPDSWLCPLGVVAVQVDCTGGGGAGGGGTTGSGGGGGGGAHSQLAAYGVIPGNVYPLVVGAGGATTSSGDPGAPGSDTSFDGAACVADAGLGGDPGGAAGAPGVGGAGGLAAASTGDSAFDGGEGGPGGTPAESGGGGGGAGTVGAGGAGGTPVGGEGGTVGGGDGGEGGSVTAPSPPAGEQPGGGGGGGIANNGGRAGGTGLVVLTYDAPVGPPANGTPITSWADLSGAGGPLTVPVTVPASNPPLYSTSVAEADFPAVQFNQDGEGQNEALAFTYGAPLPTPATYFVVAKLISTPGVPLWYVIFTAPGTANGYHTLYAGVPHSSTQTVNNWHIGSGSNEPVTVPIDTDTHIFEAIINGGSSKLWIDGLLVENNPASDPGGPGGTPPGPGTAGLQFGLRHAPPLDPPANYGRVRVSSAAVYAGVMSDEDRRNLRYHYSLKYGISVAI